MSVRDPQIAPRYGALDSAGIIDGGSFSAHHHRALVRSVNRLTSKGRLEVSLWWPEHHDSQVAEESIYHWGGGHATPQWSRFLPPLGLATMPRHTTGSARWTLRVTSDQTIEIQHATRAERFRASAPAPTLLEVTGSGNFDPADLDGVPLLGGYDEELEIWVRATSQGDLLDTVAYGGPDSHTLFTVHADRLVSPAGGWVPGGSTMRDLGQAGHGVYFLDASGNAVAVREAVTVYGANEIFFWPTLAPNEVRQIQAQATSFEIRKLPDFDVSCFAFATEGRVR